ncbi:recombinase [Flavobacteriales bacterium 33_180_T64]|nr:recombinase [Flavobacteriales bacterium 33_180_T64]
MSSSLKIVIRKKPNKEGLCPLAIRITKDRKTNYIYTGYYIDIKYWDEKNKQVRKSHPNSVRLNNLLLTKLSEANNTLIDLETNKKDSSANHIKQEVVSPLTNKSFNEVAREFLNDLQKQEKLSRLGSDRVRVNHLISFMNSENILFKEIDELLLRRFISHLKSKHKLSQRSIMNNLVVIRTLYNKAIKQGIIEHKYYPFGAQKIRIKFPETEKIGLTIEEIQRLEKLDNLTKAQRHALNAWLFSFYFAGMRVSDVLGIKWNNIIDNRLHYRMNKNEKLLSIKLPDKILPILEQYRNQKTSNYDFIFPEMKSINIKEPYQVFRKTNAAILKFNKHLKNIANKAEIDKKITMHIARHSFGNISDDKIPVKMLQKLYRHSSITTTINYQSNFIHKDVDDALDSVINF